MEHEYIRKLIQKYSIAISSGSRHSHQKPLGKNWTYTANLVDVSFTTAQMNPMAFVIIVSQLSILLAFHIFLGLLF